MKDEKVDLMTKYRNLEGEHQKLLAENETLQDIKNGTNSLWIKKIQ